MRQLEELLGDEGLESVKAYGLAQAFVGDTTSGTRRAVAGAAVDGMFSGPIGAAIVSIAGETVEKFGGMI